MTRWVCTSEPVGQRLDAVGGREEPMPGAGAYPTDAVAGSELRRGSARYYVCPHDDAVRGAQRAQRCRAGRVRRH